MTSRSSNEPSSRRALLARYLRALGDAPREGDAIVRQSESGPLPLSRAQERLWFEQQLQQAGTLYNEIAAIRLSGPLDPRALRTSLSAIVDRHHVLRTVFVEQGGEPRQIVRDAVSLPLPLPLVDLQALEPRTCERARRRACRAQFNRTFDLTTGPLLRPLLLRLAPDEHILVITAHHIAFDLWSVRIFLRELGLHYVARRQERVQERVQERAQPRKQASPLVLEPAPPPIQYTDYCRWERERERADASTIEQTLDRLARHLADLPALRLPVLRQPALRHPAPQQPAPEQPALRQAPPRANAAALGAPARVMTRTVSAEVSERLRRLAAETRVSLANLLLAAFQALLARYSGQTDFGLGLPVANRDRRECQDVIGPFVNTVLLRANLAGDPTLRELLARTTAETELAYASQHLPYETLVQRLRRGRRPPTSNGTSDGTSDAASLGTLFRVVWAFQNVPPEEWPREGGLRIAPAPTVDVFATRFDLESRVWDTPDGVRLHLIYDADSFDAASIDRLLTHFETLLALVATGALDTRLSDLPLMPEIERAQLDASNRTRRDWAAPALAHDAVTAIAAAAPDAIALVFGASQITYASLDARANQLARHLQDLGIGPGLRVGLCLPRGEDLVIALLAVLKAGAAYVPIDSGLPSARTTAMLEDAQVSLLISTSTLVSNLASAWMLDVLLDRDAARIASQPVTPPPCGATPESLAYIMFTSGSTGRPKGVMVTHAGTRNLGLAQIERFGVLETSAVLQFASASFDASTSEWTTALLCGARLVLATEESLRPGPDLLDLLVRHNVDIVTLPPSVAAALPPHPLPALRTLVLAGEAAPAALVRRWCAGRVLLNAYGPTETTVCATISDPLDGEQPIAIGGPIANVRTYVLDATGGLAPIGVPGELFIGGDGVAQGYVNQPSLTASRFVPDPFGAPGARAYRTGDRVVRQPDGALRFLGRIDQQVKWRGYRIEPQEIDAALASHARVRLSAVMLREDRPGDPRLVAYIVPSGEPPTERDLRDHLRSRLPDYMMPSTFVMLHEGPLTVSGKLDRAALPAPGNAGAAAGGGGAMRLRAGEWRTPMEEVVAAIWGQVLGRDDVARETNFFEAGGHSLLATQVMARLRSAIDVDLPLRVLFDAPTVAGVASAIDAAIAAGWDTSAADAANGANGANDANGTDVATLALSARTPAPPLLPRGHDEPAPLSFAQQRLWFLDQLEPGRALYNCHASVHLRGDLRVDALRSAFVEIVRRHAVLRSRFHAVDGTPVQEIMPVAQAIEPAVCPCVDLRAVDASERMPLARRLALAEARHPFDLARGPVLRARLIRIDAHEHLLAVTVHHIVSDGWSLGILIREIQTLYAHASTTAVVVDTATAAVVASATARGSVGDAPGASSHPLPPLPVQYADYAAWQRAWLQGAALDEQLRDWREHLAQLPVLALPTDLARPPIASGRGARIPWQPSAALLARIAAVRQQEGVSAFMILLAGFTALLARYAGQTDIVVGTDVANRTRLEVEGLVGFFVNQLVLRTDLGGDPTFGTLLRRVRETTLRAYARQDVPFDALVEALVPTRDASRAPLFQVALILQNTPSTPLGLAGLDTTLVDPPPAPALLDLTLMLERTEDGFRGALEYATDLFERPTMERWLAEYERLLMAGLGAPDRPIAEASLLTDEDRARVLAFAHPARRCETPQRVEQCRVEQRIAEQARCTPDAIAVVSDAEHLSYAALDSRANRLAARLIARGVDLETRVAIALGRTPAGVIAWLAILRAGGVAVPLDLTYPPPRLAHILTDADVRLLIADGPLDAAPQLPFITAADEASPAEASPKQVSARQVNAGAAPAVRASAASGAAVPGALMTASAAQADALDARRAAISEASLAYAMYTSGSTGTPKGAAISHGALDSYVAGFTPALAISRADRFLQLASWSFDVLVEELFPILCAGGLVVLTPEDWFRRGVSVTQLIARHQATLAELTTAHWRQWAAELTPETVPASLRCVLMGGEHVPPEAVERWRRLGVPLVHVYGLTETAVTSTIQLVEPYDDVAHAASSAAIAAATGAPTVASAPRRELSIGAPLDHARIYVLDERGELCGPGMPGELLVGGPGVARGYLNRPALTASRFVPDPWAAEPGARAYRTGDRGRWREDGTLELFGRFDAQVKVSGYRIEPGEIEQALATHPAVGEAVALARTEADGGAARIAAFVTPAADYRASRDGRTLERTRVELWPSHGEYPIYDELLYRAMAQDRLRNDVYREAIAACARGKVAVDVGTGGELVLARLCVEAGARLVYAIEQSETAFAQAAARIQSLGLGDRIVLLRGDAREVSPPEPVDLCVSELLGCIGSAEGALPILRRARRWLAPGGVMIPGRCVTRVAAIALPPELAEAPAFEPLGAHYARLVLDAVGHPFDLRLCLRHLPPEHILSSAVIFEDLRFDTDQPDAARHTVDLTIMRDGRVDGFLLWIELTPGLDGRGATIDALRQECAWLPLFMPARVPGLLVATGETLTMTCERTLSDDGLHPDYRIAGHIAGHISGQSGGRAIDATSFHHHREPTASPLHQRLFEGGKMRTREAAAGSVSHTELRRYLRERLPAHMTPDTLTMVDAFPLNTNGKIDRRALAALPPPEPDETTAEEPRTPIESEVATIWRELLGRARIGIHENFFACGGHSLLATQLRARIVDRLGVDLPLRLLFERPTIADLASEIVRLDAEAHDEAAALALLTELDAMSDAEARSLLAE